MSLIVQKFGGSSLASVERIQEVAKIIADTRSTGHDVLAVVSAMQGETDRLINLAQDISSKPTPREYDALLATGEQVTSALLCIALNNLNCDAKSFSGAQAGIYTNSQHKKSKIINIQTDALKLTLQEARVPVVTGFQGVDEFSDVTTLGRGGSDISAVALAAALHADECQIYTDVDGIYTSDPRVVDGARCLELITYAEMLALAGQGAKVLQRRAVEFAEKYRVPLRVLSSFKKSSGTLVCPSDKKNAQPIVSGVAFDRHQAKLTLTGLSDSAVALENIHNDLTKMGIEFDMLMQNMARSPVNADISFLVRNEDFNDALLSLQQVSDGYDSAKVQANREIAKLSLVGLGMKAHAGTAHKLLEVLSEAGINIHFIHSSEVKISVVINEDCLESGARLLHEAFGLAKS